MPAPATSPAGPSPTTEPQPPTDLPSGMPSPTTERQWRPVRILDHGDDETGRSWITCLDWSPDGRRLAAGDTNEVVIIWDVASGERLHVLPHNSWPESCVWSPLGDRIAVGTSSSLIRIWDTSTGEREHLLDGHIGIIYTLAWSPDGSQIAALGSTEKSARTWDWQNEEPLYALPSAEGTNDLDWSPDSTAVATSTGEGVKVWEAASGELLYTLGSAGATRSVRWSPDGLELLASGYDGIMAWEIIGRQPLEPFRPEARPASAALWSPDGSMVSLGYHDGPISVWDAETREPLLSSTAPWGSVVHLIWSADSRFLAGYVRYLGGEEFLDWILLWEIDGSSEPAILAAHDDAIFHLAWSPEENILASGAHDGQVIVWGERRRMGSLER